MFRAIEAGAEWRYLDDGSDQGVAWRRSGFDAAAWPVGRAQFGYGDGDEVTIVDDGPDRDRHITTYFLTDFALPNAAAVAELRLRLIRDDGAVVYINGIEVFRSNMGSGAVSFESRARAGVSGDDESAWIEAALSIDSLVSGGNRIAVEIHQVGPRSSDISFDLELVANP